MINLLFRSRLPPNCGVVSSTTLLSPPPPPPPDDAIVNQFALTLLKVILLPAVIKISSSVLPSLNLKFTLLPDATDD